MEEIMTVEDNATEEEADYSFTAYEIDPDYEFEAPCFFDFSRAESPFEVHEAEVWFDSAGSYPPSPFVLKLVKKEDILKDNVQISPKAKGVEDMNLVQNDSDIDVDEEISAVSMITKDDVQNWGICTTQPNGSTIMLKDPHQRPTPGFSLHSHMENRPRSKTQTKFSKNSSLPKASTLMRPTASYLAKQNNRFQAGYSRSILDKTMSSTSVNGVENQAAKRQKLEGGLLRKVESGSQLQQYNFVHKAPKREGLVDGNIPYRKPRFTIPREPDLETAHRSQRTRANSTKEAEKVTSVAGGFKALPLNRKVFEAPSMIPKRSTPCLPNFQEFHLKTSERAMQHIAAVSNSRAPSSLSDKNAQKYSGNMISDCGNKEPSRISTINTSRPDGSDTSHQFKALALNKKILESKGDIGVFRNSKKETTVPVEFNFLTGKKSHHNPPADLFSKLSLASDAQRIATVESKSNSKSLNGSKENRWDCFHLGYEMKKSTTQKLSLQGRTQQFKVDGGANGVNIFSGVKL